MSPSSHHKSKNMSDTLEQRVKELEQELAEVKATNASAAATTESLVSLDSSLLARLKRKEETCLILQARLERKSREFDTYRREIEKSVKAQMQAYVEHNEQVKSLKTLAAKDRLWLDEYTSRRRAASIAARKEVEIQVDRMQRRISTAW